VCSPDNLQKSSSSGSKVSCDYAKLRSKLDDCLSVECKDLDTCMAQASSICEQPTTSGNKPGQTTPPGGTSSGGTTPPDGAGGSSSTPGDDPASGGGPSVPPGGSGTSSGDCGVCAHANGCCQALLGAAGGDQSSCDAVSEAQCKATPAAQQSTFVQLCSQTLQGGAAAGVAACM